MQAGSYSWRGGEGSQTDLNSDDRRPRERVPDPNCSTCTDCCDESEETAAIARSQPATGFVYMVNRFYEPETGRFTQADSLAFDPTQLTNAQNNRWTYATSDPINFSDPNGLFLSPFDIAFAIGAFLGGLYAAWALGDSPFNFFRYLAGLFGAFTIKCGLKQFFSLFKPRSPLLWELMTGFTTGYNPAVVLSISFLAGYSWGMTNYALWSLFDS